MQYDTGKGPFNSRPRYAQTPKLKTKNPHTLLRYTDTLLIVYASPFSARTRRGYTSADWTRQP